MHIHCHTLLNTLHYDELEILNSKVFVVVVEIFCFCFLRTPRLHFYICSPSWGSPEFKFAAKIIFSVSLTQIGLPRACALGFPSRQPASP